MQHAMHLVVRKGNGGVRKGGDIPGGNLLEMSSSLRVDKLIRGINARGYI